MLCRVRFARSACLLVSSQAAHICWGSRKCEFLGGQGVNYSTIWSLQMHDGAKGRGLGRHAQESNSEPRQQVCENGEGDPWAWVWGTPYEQPAQVCRYLQLTHVWVGENHVMEPKEHSDSVIGSYLGRLVSPQLPWFYRHGSLWPLHNRGQDWSCYMLGPTPIVSHLCFYHHYKNTFTVHRMFQKLNLGN